MRCLVCGSSKFDPEGYKCGRCGAAMGLRSERCYITDETRKKLLDNANELSHFGISLEQVRPLQKDAGATIAIIGLVLAAADSLRSDTGSLRRLVILLRDLAIPEEEILRLRLDEPEQILTYTRMDKPDKELHLR
jgi:hypothetical protein